MNSLPNFSAKQADVNRTQPRKWLPTLVMIFTLLLLAICALPNLYPEQNNLIVSATSPQTSSLSLITLKDKLNQQGFTVSQAKQAGNTLQLTLENSNQNAAALNWLHQHYPTDFESKIVSKATSPYWLQALGLAPIKLGLDLNGGVLFVLEVDSDHALNERITQVKQQTKSALRHHQVRGARIELNNAQQVVIHVSQANDNLALVIKDLKQTFTDLSSETNSSGVNLFFNPQAQQAFHQQVMQQAITTLRGRISELGITEAVTQRQGSHKIRVELPGVQDPTAAKRIIGATASLDFHALQTIGGTRYTLEDGSSLSLNPNVVLSGQHIQGAQASRDEMGKPAVQLQLDGIGATKMTAFSKKNVGQPMATVFSEYYKDQHGNSVKKSKVINVATITSVLGSRFSITNMHSPQAAQELALLLRAGSLIAPVTIVHQQTIGPSLGQANIENGFAALALGLAITFAFMALWYRKMGWIANTVLLLNLICLIGLMSLLPGAVLTLPGIAGLVLTIGMAVDTNVIIFERIKEEQTLGRSPLLALKTGYNKAFHSIVDANITTLLTAVILYSIGYGPIKGFALTLGLGILTSLFTGVFVAKTLSFWLYRAPKNSPTRAHSAGETL
ncbi:protein-export membrane protein SecD [Pseudoalteromonas ulvae]|uniref:Protein translocase subunit SecD n=2 Tax=Pseudoalteromonas ulvae TaxID=107327 RepID=A0A244CLZ0_PSEDV|nr:protein-export membrane protein SecD [Pseudoalteromonas ulvae]